MDSSPQPEIEEGSVSDDMHIQGRNVYVVCMEGPPGNLKSTAPSILKEKVHLLLSSFDLESHHSIATDLQRHSDPNLPTPARKRTHSQAEEEEAKTEAVLPPLPPGCPFGTGGPVCIPCRELAFGSPAKWIERLLELVSELQRAEE
jgi:hypothetical protein